MDIRRVYIDIVIVIEHYKRAEEIADEMDDEFLACYTQFKQALNNAEKNMVCRSIPPTFCRTFIDTYQGIRACSGRVNGGGKAGCGD